MDNFNYNNPQIPYGNNIPEPGRNPMSGYENEELRRMQEHYASQASAPQGPSFNTPNFGDSNSGSNSDGYNPNPMTEGIDNPAPTQPENPVNTTTSNASNVSSSVQSAAMADIDKIAGAINLASSEGNGISGQSIIHSIGDEVSQGRRSEENTLHEMNSRLDKLENLTSICTNDFHTTCEKEQYNSLLRTFEGGSEGLERTMLSNSASFNQCATELDKAFVDIYNKTNNTNLSYSDFILSTGLSAESLSASQLNSFAKTGRFAYTDTSGASKILDANSVKDQIELNAIQQHALSASIEKETIHKLTHAVSTQDKKDAMKALRNDNIKHIRECAKHDSVNLGRLENFDGSRRAIQDIMKNGTDAEKNMVREHLKAFGGKSNESSDSHLAGSKRQGMRMISHKLLGSEMSQGVDFYNRGIQMTKASYRAGSRIAQMTGRAAVAVGTGTASVLLGNPVVEKINASFAGNVKNASKAINERNKAHYKKKDNERKMRKTKEGRKELKGNKRKERLARKQSRKDFIQRNGTKLSRFTDSLDNCATKKVLVFGRNRVHQVSRWKQNFSNWRLKRIEGFNKSFIGRGISHLKGTRDAFNRFLQKKRHLFGKEFSLGGVLGNLVKPLKYLNPFTYLNFLNRFRAVITKYLLMGLGSFVLILFLVFSFCSGAAAICSFFASLEWDKINYAQHLVNSMNTHLEKEYEKVAKAEVKAYFDQENWKSKLTILSDGSAFSKENYPSAHPTEGKIDWYSNIGEGRIGKMYDGRVDKSDFKNGYYQTTSWHESGSVNNIVPIMGVTHYRFPGEIGATEYSTVRGYAFYMWAMSHDTANPAGEKEYEIDPRDTTYHNMDGLAPCDNVYFHGYKKEDGLLRNQFRKATAEIGDFFADFEGQIIKFFNKNAEVKERPLKINQTVDEPPKDIIDGVEYICENYTEEIIESTEVDTNKCKLIEHTHDLSDGPNSCVRVVCVNRHCSTPKPKVLSMNVYMEWKKLPGNEDKSYIDMLNTQNNECWYYHASLHDYLHRANVTHAHSKIENGKIVPLDGDYLVTNTDNCPLGDYTAPEHTHEHEKDGVQGCYKMKTIYTCHGHCGGHLHPSISLSADFDYETLVTYDNFKCTNWVSFIDDNNLLIGDAAMSINTFLTDIKADLGIANADNFKDYWKRQASKWFFKIDNKKLNTSHFENKHLKESDEEEISGFMGWYDDDGNLKEEEIATLKELYGSIDNCFDESIDNWTAFEVTFPPDCLCKTFGSSQVSNILDTMKKSEKNYQLNNEKRRSICETALSYVGCFAYDPEKGDYKQTSGISDSAHFIASIYNNANVGWKSYESNFGGNKSIQDFIHTDYTRVNYNGSDYSRFRYPNPGDVLILNDNYFDKSTKLWKDKSGNPTMDANKVMIYIGYLTADMAENLDLKNLGTVSGPLFVTCSDEDGAKFEIFTDGSYMRYKYLYQNTAF